METAEPGPKTMPRPLMIIGGNLALDFANTVDEPQRDGGFDHVRDAAGLLAWARQVGLLSDAEHDTLALVARRRRARAGVSLRRAHALRHSVREVFGAVAQGKDVPAAGWRGLRALLTEAIAHAELEVGSSEGRLRWPAEDLDCVSWAVAYAAHELLTGPQLSRVKRCAACPWLYVDQSKNASRRWCTMDDCGKNDKMRRYVERRAARRAAAGDAGPRA